jgi:hypothetical protein
MKSSTKEQQIAKAVAAYRKIEQEQTKELQEMAQEAEDNDDYYDYDQSCYDTWEYLMRLGQELASEIEEILNG